MPFLQGLSNLDPSSSELPDILEHWIRAQGVDNRAGALLRGLEPEKQIRVMQRGPLTGGDKSKLLMSRIMQECPGGIRHEPKQFFSIENMN